MHTIALVRLTTDRRTREWAAGQCARGRAGLELLHVLKRAIAREIYRYLTRHVAVPEIADLQPLRRSKNLTVTAAANHFGVWPALISQLERGIRRNDDLAKTYREWLLAA